MHKMSITKNQTHPDNTDVHTMNQVQQHYRRHRTPHRQDHSPTHFYRVLARFTGFCGICNTSFTTGEPIYWCPKTLISRTMRCHEQCYLHRTGMLVPSSKPTPPESELRQAREKWKRKT